MPLDADGKEIGWISKHAYQHDSLRADTMGREAMEDGFTTNDKIANTTITATKLASGNVLVAGVWGASRWGNFVWA